MRGVVSICFLLTFCLQAYAQLSPEQEAQIDSLKQVIRQSENDTILVKSFRTWSGIVGFSDMDLFLALNEKVDSICLLNLEKNLTDESQYFFQKNRGIVLHNIGLCYHDNDYKKAIDYYSRSLEVEGAIEDKEGMAYTLNELAIIYKRQGNFVKAINHFSRSLKISEEIGLKSMKAYTLHNIGIVYETQGDHQKALEYQRKSLPIWEETGDVSGKAMAMSNMAMNYSILGENEKALEYLSQGLEMSESTGDESVMANCLIGLGEVYSRLGDYSKSMNYFTKSLEIREKLEEYRGVVGTLNSMGRVSFEMGNYQKSIEYNNRALHLAQKLGATEEIAEASETLWKVYRKIQNYDQALEMYELMITSRDSLRSEENQKAVIRQQYKYEYEKQAAADSVKNAEAKKVSDALLAAEKADNERKASQIRQAELERKQQNQRSYFLWIGLALALISGGFIFNRFRITKKQRDIIDEQKSAVESQKAVVEEQKAKVDDAYEQLEEKNTEILDSINYAKRIQSAILPPDKLVKQYLQNSFVLYKPKDIVAGDFYWCEPTEKGVLFAAADCTGHGVPGAMVSVVCNNGLNRSVREYGLTEPGDILTKTREIVISEFEKSEQEVKDGMDVALCFLESRTLKYAGAHNPLWIIRKGIEEVEEIKAHKQPIGKYAESSPYPTHSIELSEGDSFYIFSDGFADQFGGEKGKKFKTANFKRLLLSIQNETIERQKELIDQAFENWRDAGGQPIEQLDDVCVIGVRV